MSTPRDPDLVGVYLQTISSRYAPRTTRIYERHLRALEAALHRIPVHAAALSQLQAFLDDAAGGSAATQRYAAVRGFAAAMARDGLTDWDVRDLRPPPVWRPPAVEEFLDEATMGCLESGVWCENSRDFAVVLLVLHAGATVDELATLDWCDVGKGIALGAAGRRRLVSPTGVLRRVLDDLRPAPGATGPVLLSARGAQLSTRSFYDIVARAGEAIGEPGVNPSRLRLSGLRRMREGGASLTELARFGGYSQPVEVARAIGGMCAVVVPCPNCRREAGSSGQGRSCPKCRGTETIVAPTERYLAALTPPQVGRRLATRMAIMRQLVELPWAGHPDPDGRRHDELSAAIDRLGAAYAALHHGDAGGPEIAGSSQRTKGTAAVQCIRAAGTEVRKLAVCIAAKGWGQPDATGRLEDAGYQLLQLADLIEDVAAPDRGTDCPPPGP